MRPKIIVVKYTDPFDDVLLAESHYSYNARMSANGFYSRHVKTVAKALKSIQSSILEGRTPRINIKLHYIS